MSAEDTQQSTNQSINPFYIISITLQKDFHYTFVSNCTGSTSWMADLDLFVIFLINSSNISNMTSISSTRHNKEKPRHRPTDPPISDNNCVAWNKNNIITIQHFYNVWWWTGTSRRSEHSGMRLKYTDRNPIILFNPITPLRLSKARASIFNQIIWGQRWLFVLLIKVEFFTMIF